MCGYRLASGGWLSELLYLIAVTLDMDIATSAVQTLAFDRPGRRIGAEGSLVGFLVYL